MSKRRILHLHGHEVPHDIVIVVGNREGLKHLKKLCEEVLKMRKKPEHSICSEEQEVIDGEFYKLQVHMVDNMNPDTEPVPYLSAPYREEVPKGGKEDNPKLKKFYNRVIKCEKQLDNSKD